MEASENELDMSMVQRLERFGQLRYHEIWWRDQQKWLQQKGYLLRPRYVPDWTSSWQTKNILPFGCEDSVGTIWPNLLDARRIADGKMIILRKVDNLPNPFEVDVCRYFSSEPLVSHPQNHCVLIYDILDVPGEDQLHILVMPLLRPFNDPSFQTVGETVDFCHQIFEGLQFMHQCNVAHRDCMDLNIMLDPDPLYLEPYHPIGGLRTLDFKGYVKHHTRTWRPTKYYVIDLGLSKKYDPANGPPRDLPTLGGDKTAPEFRYIRQPHDPFPTDIYHLRNMIRESFLDTYEGLEFMNPPTGYGRRWPVEASHYR